MFGNRYPRRLTQPQGIPELHRQILNGPNSIGSYTFLKTIGEGSFAKVKLAVHKLTDQKVAIKCVDRIHAPAIVREVETWRNMHHPNIVKLFEVIVSESKIYMVTEFCDGGETFEYIYNRGRMSDKPGGEARRVFFQIVDAVRYCHEKNFVHRDLKLENILLTSNLNVKLIDFGFTRSVQTDNLLDTYCGSIAYAAPEMITASKYNGPEVDIWSLGVILYTLVCGYLPFDDDNEATVRRKIVDNEYILPEFLEDDTKDLISSILQTSGSERITIKNLLAHKWFDNISNTELYKDVDDVCSKNAELLSNLKKSGIDADAMINSIKTNACDSLYALFYLILSKEETARNLRLLSNSILDQASKSVLSPGTFSSSSLIENSPGGYFGYGESAGSSTNSLFRRESMNSESMDTGELFIEVQRQTHTIMGHSVHKYVPTNVIMEESPSADMEEISTDSKNMETLKSPLIKQVSTPVNFQHKPIAAIINKGNSNLHLGSIHSGSLDSSTASDQFSPGSRQSSGGTNGSAGSFPGLIPGTRRKSFSSILDGKSSRRGMILGAMQSRPSPTKERHAVMEVDEEEIDSFNSTQ